MRDDIFSLALTLSGAGEQEQKILKLLCSSAEDYWTERLRVPVERCPQSFACASAFLAAAAFSELRCDGVESFSAGDVSVCLRKEPGQAGDGLRRAAENLMEPFTRPDGIWLKGVSA